MRNINFFKTWVEIKQSNLIHNLSQFQKLIGPKTRFMAVVKANAYGHGLIEVSKIVIKNGADWLGVDSIDEALRLKQVGIKTPILILGYTLKSRLAEAIEHGFRLTVYNRETIEKLGEIQNSKFKNKSVNVHIKVETGTSRQGVLEKDVLDFVKLIKKYPYINIEGLSSHFANIEDTTDHRYAQKQLKTFRRIAQRLERNGIKIPLKHIACSAATILFPETHFDMVRVGISIYGLWSSKETLISVKNGSLVKQGTKIKKSFTALLQKFQLRPVMTWKTKVAQVKKLKAGTPISYGLTERISSDSRIAVLPVGYWDGYDRKLSSIGNVLIAGKRCKVLGRVCMNMIIVDVTHIPNIKIEDEVVLLGKQKNEEISADEIAQKLGTINYEVVTRINPLLPRIVV